MLSDIDIINELATARSGRRIVENLPESEGVDWSTVPLTDPRWNTAHSPIQPSSLDLHVGRIYIPGSESEELGSAGHGELSHTLRPGHSVVVSTLETISLPGHLAGIVFPPSKLSSSGILVANIGHIDPGFSGNLRFTIINMGGSNFSLSQGSVAIGTLLLFPLQTPCAADYSQRQAAIPAKGEPGADEINALAKDFADIESRIDRITRKTVNRMQWRFSLLAVVVPMILGIALGVWTIWFETGRSFADRIERADREISELENKLSKLEAIAGPRVDDIDKEVSHLRRDLDSLGQPIVNRRDKR